MKNYVIKITGSGTREQIISALLTLADNIKTSTHDEIAQAEWEDATLIAIINTQACSVSLQPQNNNDQ